MINFLPSGAVVGCPVGAVVGAVGVGAPPHAAISVAIESRSVKSAKNRRVIVCISFMNRENPKYAKRGLCEAVTVSAPPFRLMEELYLCVL